jgi:TRAP-type mannitol/chloroaromatic compound transport system permease large subunit
MLLAAFKGRMTFPILKEVMRSTLMINSMVFVILLGASVFSLVFRGLGGEELVYDILAAMPGGTAGAVLVVMLVIFVLGFFLDTFEIIFITVPIAAPVLIRLGVDPIWLGVLIGMNLQTSFLTPPFGFALFYLRGVADKAIKTIDIYRGAIPFVGLQIAGIALLWLIPDLATWLPDVLFSDNAVAAPVDVPSVFTGPLSASGIDQFDNLLDDPRPNEPMPPLDQFDNLVPN